MRTLLLILIMAISVYAKDIKAPDVWAVERSRQLKASAEIFEASLDAIMKSSQWAIDRRKELDALNDLPGLSGKQKAAITKQKEDLDTYIASLRTKGRNLSKQRNAYQAEEIFLNRRILDVLVGRLDRVPKTLSEYAEAVTSATGPFSDLEIGNPIYKTGTAPGLGRFKRKGEK